MVSDIRHSGCEPIDSTALYQFCNTLYEQGGVLTQLDLSLLSGLSANYISQALREYETEASEIVPTRG
ncbi:MAG: DUF1670 domain-containing protein, partial [Desulfobacterales bacterium]|nr:DUF1670 domain-containing protein [Desulfobacterales bacterium]